MITASHETAVLSELGTAQFHAKGHDIPGQFTLFDHSRWIEILPQFNQSVQKDKRSGESAGHSQRLSEKLFVSQLSHGFG